MAERGGCSKLLGCAVLLTFGFIGLVVVLAVVGGGDSGKTNTDFEPVVKPSPRNTAPPELQAEREEFIQEMIAAGIFDKLSVPGTDPRLYVDHGFHTLKHEEKQQFASVAYAFTYGLPAGELKDFDEPMWIYDPYTNKSIGVMDAGGLQMD